MPGNPNKSCHKKITPETTTNTNLYRLTDFDNDMTYNQSMKKRSILTERINEQNIFKHVHSSEDVSIIIMRYCSKYEICAAPKCPLYFLIDLRTYVEGDPECSMAKATRHAYWESMPEDLRKMLPYEGYFKSEYTRMRTARERWGSLTEEEKAEARERLRNARNRASLKLP